MCPPPESSGDFLSFFFFFCLFLFSFFSPEPRGVTHLFPFPPLIFCILPEPSFGRFSPGSTFHGDLFSHTCFSLSFNIGLFSFSLMISFFFSFRFLLFGTFLYPLTYTKISALAFWSLWAPICFRFFCAFFRIASFFP